MIPHFNLCKRRLTVVTMVFVTMTWLPARCIGQTAGGDAAVVPRPSATIGVVQTQAPLNVTGSASGIPGQPADNVAQPVFNSPEGIQELPDGPEETATRTAEAAQFGQPLPSVTESVVTGSQSNQPPGAATQSPSASSGSPAADFPIISTAGDPGQLAVSASYDQTWADGTNTYHLLRGTPFVRQGDRTVSAASMLLIERPPSATNGERVFDVYAERDVRIRSLDGVHASGAELLQFQSVAPVTIAASSVSSHVGTDDPVYRRAIERLSPQPVLRRSAMSIAGYAAQQLPGNLLGQGGIPGDERRWQIRQRSSTPIQFQFSLDPDAVPPEQVSVISGGVNMPIEGFQFDVQGENIRPGIIDLSADRMVVWSPPMESGGLQSGDVNAQSSRDQLQVYLEGNIVIRHQDRTLTATHAFFDANNDRAVLMNAELKQQLPESGGTLRVKAERLRQLSGERFHAQNAWLTTSPYGKPGYRLEASDVFIEPGAQTPWTGIDPLTGEAVTRQPTWVTSLNNRFVVEDFPLIWLPRISAPIEDPGIPIRSVGFRYDRIFGGQIRTVWNLSKLLGQRESENAQWDLLGDFRSERGVGGGVGGAYQGVNPQGRYKGNGLLYLQQDTGVDNLGMDRRVLQPEDSFRGQGIWRHRQDSSSGLLMFGEIGLLSDRNFREQYFEREWDEDKDAETLLGIRQDSENLSVQLMGRVQLNDFTTTTEWLPRLDAYALSKPFADGLLTYSQHSSAGYARLEPGAAPSTPADRYTPLPYVAPVEGVVAMSRHQIDAPIKLGWLNVTPYVMGEAASWGEGFSGDQVDRYLVNGGVEARVLAQRIFPFINNPILGINSIAHKSETILSYSYTDASDNLSAIPQYNEIDDNNIERIRNRIATLDYPGIVPDEFDPRFYAVRNGSGLWTTAPWNELADDQQVVRLRFRNRLQTKSGPRHHQRTRDWMIWESGLSYFPDTSDNFGEPVGLLYSKYRLNISDRTSLLADTLLDVFNNSQNIWSVGLLNQRKNRGSFYVGYRKVQAKNYFDSQIVTTSASYYMSPKWVTTASYAYDLAESQSRGSSLTLTRVGLDFNWNFGFNYDNSKDNIGVGVSVEPRIGPPTPTNISPLLELQKR